MIGNNLMKKILLGLAFLDCITAKVFSPDDDAEGESFDAWEEHQMSGYAIDSASGSITNRCSSFGLASKTLTSWEVNQECTANSTNPETVPVDGNSSSSDHIRVGQESAPSGQESVESSPAYPLASPLTGFFPSRGEIRVPDGSGTVYFYVYGVRPPQTQLELSTSPHECHVIDIERATNPQAGGKSGARSMVNLGKMFLGLTYQAVFSFVIFHYQDAGNSSSQDHSTKPPHLLQIAEVSLVVGFAASLIGILLGRAYPDKAVIIEGIGSVSASISFFVMASMVLTSVSEWVCWLGAAFSILAFVLAFLKAKAKTD